MESPSAHRCFNVGPVLRVQRPSHVVGPGGGERSSVVTGPPRCMSENLADRLDAVERALTDGDADLTEVRERAALSEDVDRLETRVEDLEAQVEQLEAALEAVRGYAGNVRAVNREVERRASAALAKAEALETAVDGPVDDAADDAASRATEVAGAGGGDRTGGSAGATVGRKDRPTDASTGDTGTRPAGEQPATAAAPDEFDWGLDEGRTRAGRETESPHAEDAPAVGDEPRRHGRGTESRARRSRRGTPRARTADSERDDDESGTEQFIERVRDAL